MKPPGLALDPGFVIFHGLQDFDIAFLWKAKLLTEPGTFPANALEACSGEVERSHVGGGDGVGTNGVGIDNKAATAMAGPGSWVYRWGSTWPDGHEAKGNPQASGANYLRMPPTVPPDREQVDWMSVQGVKGLIWEGGGWAAGIGGFQGDGGGKFGGLRRRWSGRTVAETEVGGRNVVERGVEQRSRRSRRTGSFWASPTGRGRYVDWISVNGTNFTRLFGDGDGEKWGREYRSGEGVMLDLEGR